MIVSVDLPSPCIKKPVHSEMLQSFEGSVRTFHLPPALFVPIAALTALPLFPHGLSVLPCRITGSEHQPPIRDSLGGGGTIAIEVRTSASVNAVFMLSASLASRIGGPRGSVVIACTSSSHMVRKIPCSFSSDANSSRFWNSFRIVPVHAIEGTARKIHCISQHMIAINKTR